MHPDAPHRVSEASLHAHLLFLQDVPALQTLPQVPQLLLSVFRLMQDEPHKDKLESLQTQVPP